MPLIPVLRRQRQNNIRSFNRNYKTKKSESDAFQALKVNKCQPRLLHPVKTSFKTDGEVTFPNKDKLKQLMTTRPWV